MQEENQLAVATEDPPQTSTSPPVEVDTSQPESGEHQEQQQTQEQTPKPASPEVEARARDMGWRPQNEWRGAPEAWRPADEFVRRGEEVLPIVRSRAQRAETEVANLRGQMAERDRDFEERLRRLDRVSQIALQNQAQQIGQHYRTQMREAVARGDVDGYDALDRQYAAEYGALQDRAVQAYQQPPPQEQQQQQPIDPQIKQTIEQWIGRNGWWHRDPQMREAAANFHGFLQRTQRMSIEDNLAEVDRYMQSEFPDRFPARQATNGAGNRQQQTQQHAPAVEGGGRQPGSSASRPKGWNDLPPEAKKAGERFISQELYANDAKGRAEYAAEYWSQD